MRRRQPTAPRLRQIVASRMLPSRLRVRIYRLIGIPIGQGSGVMSDVFIDGNGLYIGDRCFINRFCRLDANAPIIIEDGVYLAFGVTVLTSSHEHGTAMMRAGHTTWEPVTIGRGSWIGTNATILPGVTIGEGCVIAAGSVVTADTKPDTLYAGVPGHTSGA